VNNDSLADLRDKVTVVIPTLNEEDAIGKLIPEVKACGYNNILVVDGYSHDQTKEIAEGQGARVVGQRGKGKAGAILTATDFVETPYLLVMDGDYSYDPADIDRFLQYMEKYDHIIGSRPLSSPNISMTHRVGNWILTKSFNLLMGSNIPDVCSGMYLLRTARVRKYFLDKPGFVVDQEIAAQSLARDRLTFVPIRYRARIGKAKASTWRQGFRALFTILDLARCYNPVLMMASIASLALVPAIALIAYTAILNYVYHDFRWGLAILSTMLFIFAAQGITVATLSIQIQRVERRLEAIGGKEPNK
jgi:dolichol-phosphate mannosyltransferase